MAVRFSLFTSKAQNVAVKSPYKVIYLFLNIHSERKLVENFSVSAYICRWPVGTSWYLLLLANTQPLTMSHNFYSGMGMLSAITAALAVFPLNFRVGRGRALKGSYFKTKPANPKHLQLQKLLHLFLLSWESPGRARRAKCGRAPDKRENLGFCGFFGVPKCCSIPTAMTYTHADVLNRWLARDWMWQGRETWMHTKFSRERFLIPKVWKMLPWGVMTSLTFPYTGRLLTWKKRTVVPGSSRRLKRCLKICNKQFIIWVETWLL